MKVFCKLTVLHLPESLKLDKLPGAKQFCRTHKIFARKLENRGRGQNC